MKRAAVLLSILLLAGAGCGTQPPSGETPNGGGTGEGRVSFVVGSWKLAGVTRAGQAAQDVSDLNATLTLDASGRLSAVICNSMSGGYSIENGELKAPEVMSTLKYCEGLPSEIEAAFLQDLSAGFAIEGAGGSLALRGDSGTRFSYERSAAAEPDAPAEEAETRDVTTSGTVTSVNLEGVMVDGPAVVSIRTEAGALQTIHVPSFGLMLCAAQKSIADVYALREGDRVEVRGSASAEGAIVPCESTSHYLRVTK